jgi:hypothetical protein
VAERIDATKVAIGGIALEHTSIASAMFFHSQEDMWIVHYPNKSLLKEVKYMGFGVLL